MNSDHDNEFWEPLLDRWSFRLRAEFEPGRMPPVCIIERTFKTDDATTTQTYLQPIEIHG